MIASAASASSATRMSRGGSLRNCRRPSTTSVIFEIADHASRDRALAAPFSIRFSAVVSPSCFAHSCSTSTLTRSYQISSSGIRANSCICRR